MFDCRPEPRYRTRSRYLSQSLRARTTPRICPAAACGDVTEEAHERAVRRLVQAGAVPMNSLEFLFGLQQDWARSETYEGCMEIMKAHSPYGIEVAVAKDATAAFTKEMMHAAHELNGPTFAHDNLTTAELVAALPIGEIGQLAQRNSSDSLCHQSRQPDNSESSS
jgi:hypothetical protein